MAGPGARSGDGSRPWRAHPRPGEGPLFPKPSCHPPAGQLQPVRTVGSSDMDAELTTRAEQRPSLVTQVCSRPRFPQGEPLTEGQGDLSPLSVSWGCKALEPADSKTDGG